MCLAIPMTIKKIDGFTAVAESRGVETMVDITLMPEIKVKDKVLVHAGFIIEKLDKDAAKEIEDTWDECLKLLEESGDL